MSWGLFAAAKAAGAAVRDSEDRPRGSGATPAAPTSPRPVSFVVPVWLGVFSGCFLATGGLWVMAFLLRVVSGRSAPTEALGSALLGALVCGLPGLALAVAGTSGHRRRERYRQIQARVQAEGQVTLGALARDLRIDEPQARALALEVLREGHVIGHLDAQTGQLRAGDAPTAPSAPSRVV